MNLKKIELKNSFSKILVCIDGSKYSEKALENAISLAKQFNSKLFLLYVIDKSTIDFWNNSEYVGIVSKSLLNRKIEAKNFLDKKTKKIQNKIQFKNVVLEGSPSSLIIQFSKKNNMDVIILGNRGIGGFKKLLLGSVSTNVVEHSSCSVLIIKM